MPCFHSVYATVSPITLDGRWIRLPSLLHGGRSFPAVATGWEAKQEGRLREHFPQRESVAAAATVPSSRGPGCWAEGRADLGPQRWGWAGPGSDRTEGPESPQRAEDSWERRTGNALAASLQPPQVPERTWCSTCAHALMNIDRIYACEG